jgi:hypothetical protein
VPVPGRLGRIEAALGIQYDTRTYIVKGSPEAVGLDLDFDLTLMPDLAKNQVRRRPPAICILCCLQVNGSV